MPRKRSYKQKQPVIDQEEIVITDQEEVVSIIERVPARHYKDKPVTKPLKPTHYSSVSPKGSCFGR